MFHEYAKAQVLPGTKRFLVVSHHGESDASGCRCVLKAHRPTKKVLRPFGVRVSLNGAFVSMNLRT